MMIKYMILLPDMMKKAKCITRINFIKWKDIYGSASKEYLLTSHCLSLQRFFIQQCLLNVSMLFMHSNYKVWREINQNAIIKPYSDIFFDVYQSRKVGYTVTTLEQILRNMHLDGILSKLNLSYHSSHLNCKFLKFSGWMWFQITNYSVN